STTERLAIGQSAYLSIRNPLNAPERYVRRGDVFREWIETLMGDENLDIVGLRLPLPRRREDEDVIARFRDLVEIAGRSEKLVVLFSRASISLPEYWRQLVGQNPIPFLLEYRKGFKAIKALLAYQQFLDKERSVFSEIAGVDREKVKHLLASNDRVLTEREGKKILAQYGIPTTPEALAHSEEEAVALSQTIGYPLVLKVESRQIAHKTDAGAVRTNIANEAALIRAYREIEHNARTFDPRATIDGMLVQKMIPGGKEVIIGMTRDPQFGPVIACGIGGVFVEIINDLSMRVAPLSRTDAIEMVSALKGYRILKGARGGPESDIEAVVDMLLRFSQLSLDLADEITAIDINPLIVLETGKGAVAADCLMTRKRSDL
ncbi:MAG: acetate--CoA ligase family protein, partial [Candidatus Binatia bacterium]